MLLLHIALFYLILVGVNLPAPFLGLKFDQDDGHRLWYAPPGFLIPVAWFVLFTLLGVAHYRLGLEGPDGAQGWLVALAVLCASYAYYTLGLEKLTGVSALWYGLWGNFTVIAFATLVVTVLLPVNAVAAYLTAPVIVWTAYATAIVGGELHRAEHH
ncbi:tryptophan-rich sensory protein [Neolewinella xylanilytica]|nr:TspO/MBR family protein [Neolewinella xylanilytica]